MGSRRCLFSSVAAAVMGVLLSAQSPNPTFEVAAVRRNVSDSSSWSQGARPGGVYAASNVSFLRLVSAAYNVDLYRVTGGPDWLRDARFDVNAKAAADVPNEQVRLMLQSLLAERFKLVIRKEPRDMPIYSLVLERSDGGLGPGLIRVNDCQEARTMKPPEGPSGATTSGSGCGTIGVIAAMAARALAAPVVNDTDVAGTFAYFLSYSPDLSATVADAPSLPTALREQLGLKLIPTRGPVDVIVIDSVQQPTEN